MVVDCSHSNSSKDYRRQPIVAENIFQQIVDGNKSIIGLMLESHLNAGKQSADLPKTELAYGVSVTDACIDFDNTITLIEQAEQMLANVLKSRIN